MKHSHPIFAVLISACFIFQAWSANAQSPTPRVYGKGHPFQVEELPAGKLKTGLQALDPQARGKALKWLHEFSFGGLDAAEHLRVDNGGGIYIVCPDDHGNYEGHPNGAAKPHSTSGASITPEGITGSNTGTTEPPVEKAAVAVGSPPAYSSKPGATRHIYLDFNGGIVTGTAWNSSSGVSSYNVKVWTQDADSTTFSDTEQTWMRRVWQRVAEDYAPFDVDVTTDVAYDPDNYTGNKDNVGWVLICDTSDNNGVALPHNGSGGIAYVGVFGNSTYSPTYQPAWVTSTNGGGNEAIIAEAAAHEMGHNMGLSHDGTSTLAYYGGHAATTSSPSWGPIMGTGYNQNISQWSKGEYYDYSNPSQKNQSNVSDPDDLAIMSARIPYRVDDHGDTPATATTWTSSPVNQAGIVETTSDPDYFKFTAAAGPISFSANPFRSDADTWGGNLDILMELYDSNQVLVASNNPAATAVASISTTVAAGTYYLVIKPSGAGTPLANPPSGYTVYGSLGQYTITGTYTATNDPEIAIEQPVGTDLVDGSASINCGSVLVGASSSPFTFTVKNVGTANLAGLSISTDGANSADFTVGSLGATTLAAGTSTTFTVTFSPGATGAKAAAIHIASNDADENPFDINLTGTGATPGALTVTAATGLASSGAEGGPFTPSSVSYTLTNPGGSPINWSASKTQSWVTLSTTSGTLAAGGNTTVNVTINSGANSLVAGGYNDLVSFVNSTNGSGNTTRDVALSINGVSTLWNQNFDSSTTGWTSTSESGSNSWSLSTSASHTPTTSFFAVGPSSTSITHLTSPPISIPAAPSNLSLEFWQRYDLQSNRDCGKFYLSIDGGAWFEVTSANSGVVFTENGYNSTMATNGQANPFAGQQAWSGTTSNAFVKTVINFTDIPKYAGKQLSLRWTLATNNQTSSPGWYVDSVSLISSSTPPPGTLAITPAGDLNSSGSIGGPFLPSSQIYTLQNTGATSINWTAAKTAGWVTLSATNGSLAAGASTTVTASINSAANSLLAGSYNDIVSFTNSTNGGGNATRNVSLSVVGPGSLSVTPAGDLTSSGSFGGPFSPSSKQYTLQNNGTTPLNWTAAKSANWVTLSSTSGTLDAGTSTTVTVSLNAAANSLNAGGYSDTVSFTNTTNGSGNDTRNISLTVNPQAATVTLGNLSQTFNGSAKSATATTSPTGLNVSFTYNGSSTAPTNAGSYTVVGTINDPNYTGSSSGTLVISKATATVTLGSLSQTYNGSAKSATATTSPAGLGVSFTYNGSSTAPTTAGSYTVVGTVNDTNYTGSATGTLVISKASATVTLGSLSQTYNGSARSATATTSPAGLSVGFTYNGSATAPINAGSYSVSATISDTNYTGSATGTLVIAKATATVSLSGLSATYDGTQKLVAATTSPAGLTVGFTYDGSSSAPTNAGTYAIVATVNDSNYNGTATGSLVIAKAPATVTLGGLSATYDGVSKSASSITSPAGLAVGITYDGLPTPPVAAGSYATVATISDSNYSGTASGTLVISPASAVVTLGNLSPTYDGSPKQASVTTSPAGLPTVITYNGSPTPPTHAGAYSVIASVTDPNYSGSGSGSLVIGKATASVSLGGLAQTYDGSTRTVSATTSPAGLNLTITYNGSPTPPVASGTYPVVATISDSDYQGSASALLVISKASATVTLGGLSASYDGNQKIVIASTSPSGLNVQLTYEGGVPPTHAGSYAVAATVDDPNYSGAASGTLEIAKAMATIELSGLSQVHDGSPKSVGTTTNPAGLSVSITYNGSSTPPSAAGSYAIIASITDANYTGSSSGTLVISNDLVVTASESLALPNTTTAYGNLLNDGTLTFGAGTVTISGNATNHGVLRLTGDAVLNVSGTFTNTGVIDIINWSGTLPPGLINSGTILDRSAIRVTSTQASASTFSLSVPGYAGHLYQLETKSDLTAAWQPLGSAVAGTGTATNPPALQFTPALDGPRRFYRVVVTPAP